MTPQKKEPATRPEESDGAVRSSMSGPALFALLMAALGLMALFWVTELIQPSLDGIFRKPPIYGYFEPTISWLALAVVPATILFIAVSVVFVANGRLSLWLGVTISILCSVALAAAITLVRGDPGDLVRRISNTDQLVSYASDVRLIVKYGVREFTEKHPSLASEMAFWNTRTHPPGPVLTLHGLFEVFGARHTLRVATAVATLGMTSVIGSVLIGRTIGGERVGRIAGVLFLASPGPLLLAFSSMDLIFAAGMSIAAGLFVVSAKRRSLWWAASAGVVLGVTTLMTFATVFIAVAATVNYLVQPYDRRQSLAKLAAAAAGGLAALALATVGLGFDLIGSYAAVPEGGGSYQVYWIIGGLGAWLIFAGLPIAAFGTWGLFQKCEDGSRPTFALALVTIMLIWAVLPPEVTKLRPGELERTWAFVYPVMAAVAAPVVDRWTRSPGRFRNAIIPGLLALSIVQAVAIQTMWDTLY